jgi:hypothetical protein
MSIKLTDRQNAMLHAAALREDRCMLGETLDSTQFGDARS